MAVNPKSLENLKKGKPFSAKNARENGRKGGIATKTNAQRIKEHKERWLAILDTEDFTGMTLQERMDRALIRLVIENGPGAVAAYKTIMEYVGKSPEAERAEAEQKLKREKLKLEREALELQKLKALGPGAEDLPEPDPRLEILEKIRQVMNDEHSDS